MVDAILTASWRINMAQVTQRSSVIESHLRQPRFYQQAVLLATILALLQAHSWGQKAAAAAESSRHRLPDHCRTPIKELSSIFFMSTAWESHRLKERGRNTTRRTSTHRKS